MDSKTTIPVAPDPLATMFQNATIDKAENSEFSNSARDMFKIVQNNYNFTKEGENLVLESSDVIDLMRNVAQPFLAEVRNNDQSRSTVGDMGEGSSDPISQAVIPAPHPSTPGEVDIRDLVPPEPSSLPVTSIADLYTRSMLKCFRGYPVYNPNPFCELSTEYLRNGINVGDVGFVRGSGSFDFLFNICPSHNGFINPPNLPDGFSLETRDHSATTVLEPFPPNTRLFQSPVTKTRSGEYICQGSEGAVLELPKGAVQGEAINTRPFEKLAARHGVQWYEYTMTRGRSISNGSLYLITSVTKCAQWGIAVFDRPCTPGQGLRFDKKRPLRFGKSTSTYRWKGSDIYPTKVSDPDQGDTTNQCVFVRGYKIMIRQDIFDNLCNDQPCRLDSELPPSSPQAGSSSMTRQRATRIRGGGGPDPVSRLTGASFLSRTSMTKSHKEVVLHPDFNPSIVHPSDLINAALMSQNPGAKVALTHDDVWCNLLRDNFPRLNYATLINVARIYTIRIEDDCIFLEKNVLEEISRPNNRASRLQSDAIVVEAVQFGWDCRDDVFSIEWESISQRSYTLKFNSDRNEIRITMTQRASSDMYYIAIRYSQIRFISLGHQEPSIYFSLFQPPWFESERLLASANNGPRQRLPYLPFQDHARVVPYTSIALRLICAGEEDIDTFRDLCADAQMQGVIYDWEMQTECRGLFSAGIIDWYSDWIKTLPWEVAFQVEAIVRNMFVDFREMFSLKDKISLMVDEHGNIYTSQMLKHFYTQLSAYDDGEGDVEQWFDNAAIEFAKVSKAPSLAPTNGNLFQSLHIAVTPTTILLEGPVLEQSNRVIRSYNSSNQTCFLRVNFVDEDGLTYRFDRDIDGPDFIRRRVGSFLFEGLTIAGRSFSFLAYSQSALKEHGVWFVKPFSDPVHGWVTAKTIIESLGQFTNLQFDKKLIYCPARYAARISQAFTATDASVLVEVDEIKIIRDIETNDGKYVFTDGVGKVSATLAEEIWNELKRTRKRAQKRKTHPKAFQIRFQGSKGMLSVDTKLSGRVLCLRPSMIKFEDPHSRVIEVAKAFDRPTPYFLNRPLIVLLEGLGVPFETFKTYQDLAVMQATESVLSTDTTAAMLEGHGLGTSFRLPSVLLGLHKRRIKNLLSNSFWKKTMDFAVYHVLRELKYHGRIPIPGAWTLVGVADEHNFLQPGEIFACVMPHAGEQAIYLKGDILISRAPTIHPGDVQVARAIGVPPPGSPFEKDPLPNTVIFSTKGERPLPSCLGGGDLDGDLYNLLPLDEIPEFTPRSLSKPAQYIPAEKKYLDRPSRMRDVAEFVLEFINNDMMGIIAINWLIIADQSPKHIFDKDCLTLAQLLSDAIDYPKTGMPVKLDCIPKLKLKQKPDWSAPETINQDSTTFYKSTRALGRLFREIELPSISTEDKWTTRRRLRKGRKHGGEYQQASDFVVSQRIIEEIELLIDETLRNRSWVDEGAQATIEQIYDRYVSELRTICANHTLSHPHLSSLSEEEAFMGTIVAKTSQSRKRKDMISRLREQTDVLVRGVNEELSGDEDTPPEEVIERSWLAWEFALSKGTTFGAQSFSWLALQNVFEAVHDAEEAHREDALKGFY